jgi:hypothetical protein
MLASNIGDGINFGEPEPLALFFGSEPLSNVLRTLPYLVFNSRT